MRINERVLVGEVINRPVSGNFMYVRRSGELIEVSVVGGESLFVGQGESYPLGLGDSVKKVQIKNISSVDLDIDLEFTEKQLTGGNSDVFVSNGEGDRVPVSIDQSQLEVDISAVDVANASERVNDKDLVIGQVTTLAVGNSSNILVRATLLKDCEVRVGAGSPPTSSAGDRLLYEGDSVEIKTSENVFAYCVGSSVTDAVSVVVLRRADL